MYFNIYYTGRNISCLFSVPPGKCWKKNITLNLVTIAYFLIFYKSSFTDQFIIRAFIVKVNATVTVLTYSMEQSPTCETNRFSFCQEIPLILCYPTVHYHIYKSPTPFPILGKTNPVHVPTLLTEDPF